MYCTTKTAAIYLSSSVKMTSTGSFAEHTDVPLRTSSHMKSVNYIWPVDNLDTHCSSHSARKITVFVSPCSFVDKLPYGHSSSSHGVFLCEQHKSSTTACTRSLPNQPLWGVCCWSVLHRSPDLQSSISVRTVCVQVCHGEQHCLLGRNHPVPGERDKVPRQTHVGIHDTANRLAVLDATQSNSESERLRENSLEYNIVNVCTALFQTSSPFAFSPVLAEIHNVYHVVLVVWARKRLQQAEEIVVAIEHRSQEVYGRRSRFTQSTGCWLTNTDGGCVMALGENFFSNPNVGWHVFARLLTLPEHRQDPDTNQDGKDLSDMAPDSARAPADEAPKDARNPWHLAAHRRT